MRTNSFLGNFGEEIRNEENKSAMSKAIAGKLANMQFARDEEP
jgi:hypothetical protein